MTTTVLERHDSRVRVTELLAVALLQYGLARALARAVGAATRRETAELEAHARQV